MCAGMYVEVADCYKRRITKHARPKEYPLPSAAVPRVRARLMAAFETIRNALRRRPAVRLCHRRAPGKYATK